MIRDDTTPTWRSIDMPRLVVELPDGKEIQHHLSGKEITIGRDPKNRIVIADDFMSKFHAKLIISNTSLVLVDLASANKTFVNDQPISEAPVRYGDKIRFGAVKCRLEAPEGQGKKSPPVATPTPQTPPVKAPRKAESPKPPLPVPAPRPSPRAAAKPSPATPGSAPPPIQADPMKRLLRIGGLLILVSLALAIMLRVLLVPSQAPPESEAEAGQGTETTVPPADPAPPTASTPVTTMPAPVTPTAPDANAEYYFDEGLAHLDTGRLREARESFDRALELDPDHSRAGTRLSLLEEEIEKKIERHFDNARQAFQFLRYEEAIAEWEMFLLLADQSDTRYGEAQQGIQQAQAKLR